MTLAYFDCFAGAAGDMIVGALLDAGADFDALQATLAKLQLEHYGLRRESVMRGGLGGTKFHVDLHEHDHAHRHLSDIVAIIERAGLAPRVADRAKRIFTTLAHAEAKVHRISVEMVHFHEVGAIDSIMDIVGACVAMELLGIDEVCCSAIPTGSGTIQCDHGLLPVPAPATAQMLRGVKIATTPLCGEVTTPTAAAILTTLSSSYGPLPAMNVQAVGYGAGSRQGDQVPNLLRVFVGQSSANGPADTVVELSANIDDASGEVVGAAIGKLMDFGCLDAWAAPIYMKKNRPAWLLSALCPVADVEAVEAILFAETTTFGVRRRTCLRTKLIREHQTVETPYGPIRIKIGRRGEQIVTAAPEFEDCSRAAKSHHVAVKEVMESAVVAYRTGNVQ